MADPVTVFLTKFHDIQGDLISERKKNFFKLLKSSPLSSDRQQLDTALKNLQPRTYLESLFRLDALIYFKRTAELVEILKEGNEVFASKIIKQPWFFAEAFKSVDADKFVNEFLPCTSYSLRMKLLKRISLVWNESQMDALFDRLLERYGLRTANTIVHRCSAEKIERILSEHEIQLRPNQVKYLFDTDLVLFKTYLSYYKRVFECVYIEGNVSKYVAAKNPELLLDLEKGEKLKVAQLGRRLTGKLVNAFRDDVVNDINKYTKFLKCSVMVRKLGVTFENVYRQLFPKNINDIRMGNKCNKLLSFYSKKKRWKLFSCTFSEKHNNKNIQEVFIKLNDSILKLYPQNDIIQLWAENNYNVKKDCSFLKYLVPSISIPLLKEEFQAATERYHRDYLIVLMVESCAKHNDVVSLGEVIKYMSTCTGYRNEDEYFWLRFLDSLGSCSDLKDLDETYWTYINQQIKRLKMDKDYKAYEYDSLLQKYLCILVNNGKPYKDILLKYDNDMITSVYNLSFCQTDPKMRALFFVDVIKIIPQVDCNDSRSFEQLCRKVICDVVDFSISNPQYYIIMTDYPLLTEHINVIFDTYANYNFDGEYDVFQVIAHVLHYNITFPNNAIRLNDLKLLEIISFISSQSSSIVKVVEKMITKTNRSDFENEVLVLCFEKIFDTYAMSGVITWFLRNEPHILLPYFYNIVKKSLTTRLFNYREIRLLQLYSHFEFDRKIVEYYNSLIIDGCFKENTSCTIDTSLNKRRRRRNRRRACTIDKNLEIIKHLAILLPTENFASIIDKHYMPKKEKLDLEDKEMTEIYKTQCEIIQVLHRVTDPRKMLDVVIKFCLGDFLQSALPALYSVFYRSPENQLLPYLTILANRAVSVKKHAVFLSCELLDKNYIIDMLQTTKLSNVSNQKYFFSAALKYFQKNPSQELLDLVIANLSTIDKNDTETLDSLTNVKVPTMYRAAYIEKCWEFFESMQERGVDIFKYLDTFLEYCNNSVEVLKALQSGFVTNIIKRYFEETQCNMPNVDGFLKNVLKFRKSEQIENFNLVFEKLSKFKYKRVLKFFGYFNEYVFESSDKEFLDLFTGYWTNYFSVTDTFEEFITLKYLELNYVHTNLPDYANSLVLYMDQLIFEFGFNAFKHFEKVFRKDLVVTAKTEMYSLFREILEIKRSPSTCLLVLHQLENISDVDVDLVDIHREILKVIENVEEPIVQINYKSYLINNKCSDYKTVIG